MKNLNNLTKTVFIFTLALWMSACADLDLPNDGRITFQEMFSTYPRINSYYASCVRIPVIGFVYEDTPLASFCDEAHDASDMMSGAVYNWYNDRLTPTSNPLGNFWGSYYIQIGRCNTFLQYLTDPALPYQFANPDEKDGMIAEVRVARAYYYLQLIKRYGGVPIIDTPYEMDHDFSNDKRATFEEVADFIIAECDLALSTKETEGFPIGFRWAISDAERGKITRAFAYAVKSQTALFAASPLWNTPGSKYTWEKATEITKEALDQCLAHGFQLHVTPVDPGVAQNPYAYYFITRSDGSRSWDRETIFESGVNSPVWQLAGLPITPGMSKAGPCPSQELVDSYEMQATGEPPILGYSDANHLQPIPNPASGYDANQPYNGRDPRFYASIYYNGAPRNLNTYVDIPFHNISEVSELTMTVHDNYLEFVTRPAAGMPFVLVDLSGNSRIGVGCTFSFEYQLIDNLTGQFIMMDVSWNWMLNDQAVPFTGNGIGIDPDDESLWQPFSYNLMPAINVGWGDNTRILFNLNRTDLRMLIRNVKVVSELEPIRVETFVDGNCGISNLATDIRFTRTGYYMRKFNNYLSDNSLNADGYMRIFRLAELYLNFAEAASQSAGPDTPVPSTVGGSALSARDAVNTVRKRAGMPDFPSGMTREAFESKYRNERRVELAFEEHRFYDVRRWKILNQTDGFVTGMRITGEGTDLNYTRIKLADRGTNADKYLMFPLSAAEVQKMEALTGENWQNPEW